MAVTEAWQLMASLVEQAAETAASWPAGQALLHQAERALWTLDKSARWAVPPSLDTEDKPPQQELVRPLPWPLFLPLLLVLRCARETISVINLLFGKPPLRPAEVVSYIQSKRRYVRALKYQGSRNMRSRDSKVEGGLASGLYSMLALGLCFRREQANNNANHEVLVVKRNKKKHNEAVNGEDAMERLLGKMEDMYTQSSDDDTDFTLTNDDSMKSITSEETDAEKPAVNESPTDAKRAYSTPIKADATSSAMDSFQVSKVEDKNVDISEPAKNGLDNSKTVSSAEPHHVNGDLTNESPKAASESIINSERSSQNEKPEQRPTKMVNGGTKSTALIVDGKNSSGSEKLKESALAAPEGSYQQKTVSARGRRDKSAGKLMPEKSGSPLRHKSKESRIRKPSARRTNK